jgi:pimeloyl-ACP methyl ester carboxylesterase
MKSARPIILMQMVRWAAAAVFLSAAGLAAAVITFGLYASRPAPSVIGPVPPGLHAENVALLSASGATLRGWFVAGKPGGGAMVLMHGVRANRLSMLARTRLLNAAGFSVLLFDFQAHGESEGTSITFGRLEAQDEITAVTYMQQRLPHERIGVIGTSLGGAAALLGPEPLPVDALVLESVYPDIEDAVADRIHSRLGPVLGAVITAPLTKLFEALLPPVLGLNPADLRPIDHIAKANTPVFVASGERDGDTTISEARAMFDRAPAPKLFWSVPGAGHVDLEAYAPEEYRSRILPFLIDALQRVR